MEIIKITEMETCFDGTSVYELSLSDEMTEAFMKELVYKGYLDYYPNFARPFFRIKYHDGFYIKGILGSNSLRVHTYEKAYLDELKVFIEERVCV